jgi:hypothetical protein
LVYAAPDIGLHRRLVDDIKTAAAVYTRIRCFPRVQATTDIKISIGPDASNDSLVKIGPKSLGGTAWKANKEYEEVIARPEWRDPGYSKGFSPCVAFGWIAVMIKTVPAQYAPDVISLQLLNVVDYDLDYGKDNERGFQNGFQVAARYACESGTILQGAAFTGMISFDFQTFVRHIQNEWVLQNESAFNLGREVAIPVEWMAVQLADTAVLVPFAFQGAEEYNISRTGMAGGMILLQCHDFLFDVGCSNRMNTVAYAEHSNVGKLGIHAAFAVGIYEATT